MADNRPDNERFIFSHTYNIGDPPTCNKCSFTRNEIRARPHTQRLCDILAAPPQKGMRLKAFKIFIAVFVQLRDIIRENAVADINTALTSDLPFRIPLSDLQIVNSYPDIFRFATSAFDPELNVYLAHRAVGSSEMTVNMLDTPWITLLSHLISGGSFYFDQYDPSSRARLRPDFTFMVNGALAFKREAKYNIADLETARAELIDKLSDETYMLFPTSCSYILGVTSAISETRFYLITYDLGRNIIFESQFLRSFDTSTLDGRVNFLRDFFKVMLWIAGIRGPTRNFHLIPGVRLRTPNGHHITWTRDGLLKEFDLSSGRNYSNLFSCLEVVYRAKLLHIEHGYIHSSSIQKHIIITRIGCKINHSNLAQYNLSKLQVREQVEQGLNELHELGFAHCDIFIDNIFIDVKTGVVFLGDLEFLTPVNDLPPHRNRIHGGIQIESAAKLDWSQFGLFLIELDRI